MGNACSGEQQLHTGFGDNLQSADDQQVAANLEEYEKQAPNSSYAKRSPQHPRLTQAIEATLNELSRDQPIYQYNSNASNGYELPCFYIPSLKAYYMGHWKDRRPAEKGRMYFENGNFYTGSFVSGLPQDDDGLLVYPDGSYKQGSFRGGMLYGTAKFVYKVNGMVYEGEWLHDRPHGQGVEKFRDGSSYRGKFENGLKHDDEGIYTWPNGKVYRGAFENGYIHGFGTIRKGKAEYSGYFEKNIKEDKKCEMETAYGTYRGPFLNGEMSGQGEFTWNDGKKYTGGFLRNQLHGQGVMKYPNGQVVKGIWEFGENATVDTIEDRR